MAFRRDALLAIGGFNPIYLRAGDDVDVCWRLQARGWKIGFASAALVWHHHRASVKAYWRQQVGYGEGETWLMAHHPEKFLDGRMLWRGRIYSPLPFVRSLWGTRINAGVWGTAAFPSVYRTDVHPFAFLPHSIRWQVDLVRADAGRRWSSPRPASTGGRRRCCSAAASSASPSTIAKNIAYAMRSDVDSLPGRQALVPRDGRVSALPPAAGAAARADPRRAVAAGGGAAAGRAADAAAARGRRSPEAWRALLLISGNVTEDRFWSETWTSGRSRAGAAHRLAAPLARGAHRSRSTKAGPTIATSACSSAAGRGSTSARWSRSTAAARRWSASARTCGRPTFGVVAARRHSARRCSSARAAPVVALRWPLGRQRSSPSLTVGADRRSSRWRTAQTTAIVRRGIARVTLGTGMVRDAVGARRACRSSRRRCCACYGLRSAIIFVVMIVALGAGTFMLREAATGAGDRRHARATPATTDRRCQAWLDTPGGIAVAPQRRHLLRRLEQRRDPPRRRAQPRHRAGRRQPRARQRLLRRQRSGDRRAARHAGRRRDRARRRPHRRRLAQRSHPPRRSADRHHHDDRRIGRERLRRRRQAGDRGGAEHAERRRRRAATATSTSPTR